MVNVLLAAAMCAVYLGYSWLCLGLLVAAAANQVGINMGSAAWRRKILSRMKR